MRSTKGEVLFTEKRLRKLEVAPFEKASKRACIGAVEMSAMKGNRAAMTNASRSLAS